MGIRQRRQRRLLRRAPLLAGKNKTVIDALLLVITFAVRRPGSPAASPRVHSMPCGDVPAAAFTPALQAKPQTTHRKRAWLSRLSLKPERK